MKRAVIFCSGPMETDAAWREVEPGTHLILCADGGLRHALRLGLCPDLVIGDRDSYPEACHESVPWMLHPVEKDETDTKLCLDYAIEKGCDEVVLLGALGGDRLDHEFSHYCLLMDGLNQGVKVRLLNDTNEIWMEAKPFSLEPDKKQYISFFPFGGVVEGFSVKGLKYTAENLTLACHQVLTISNVFDGSEKAEISFDTGYLLVMRSCDES